MRQILQDVKQRMVEIYSFFDIYILTLSHKIRC